MIFNSLTFFLFLLVVIPLYWVLPRTPRLMLILAAGMVFYGFWRFDFLALLMASITFDYFSGRIIASASDPRLRRLFLSLSVAINLTVLIFFKYFYFLTDNAISLASLLNVEISRPTWNIILPIGISFYTFHAMSYIIDVYRGHTPPVRNYLLFCNYVIFFPQLVAGPILRAGEMIWQLDTRPDFAKSDISAGLSRIAAGLILKVVFADTIGGHVDTAYAADPANLFPIDTLVLGFLFGLQIYFDFAGYSHIALGVALLMGIRFPENFHFPYHALNPRIFWRRWHISLSSWIRDYVYLPLAGVKVSDRMSTGGIGIDGTGQIGRNSAFFALFATWAIMGLWHGAAWTFVLWGLWHAALVQGHRQLSLVLKTPQNKVQAQLMSFGGWAITLALVMIGWIPFRATSLDFTLQVWMNLFDWSQPFGRGLRESSYLVAAFMMALVIAAPFAGKLASASLQRLPALQPPLLAAGWTFTLFFIVIYLRPISQFIYFQF